MPRVLVVAPRYWPALGGAEQHTRRLIHAMSGDVDCSVVRFCSVEETPTDIAFAFGESHTTDDDGVPIHQCAAKGPVRALLQGLAHAGAKHRVAASAFRKLATPVVRRSIQELARDVDVVHAVYNGFTPAAQAAASLGKPFVWTPLAHTTLKDGTGWSSPGFCNLYRKADALIAMTDFERDWLVQHGADRTRTHVAPVSTMLPNVPVDERAFREKFGIGARRFVLFLGRMTDAKGSRLLAEAAPKIWSGHPDTAIVFAGAGDPNNVMRLPHGADPRLIICGPLNETDKQSALSACDMLCVPSVEESLGVVYLEAWTFSKPVIAADIPVLRTVIDNGVDGVLTENSVNGVASSVTNLLSAPDQGQRMGAVGRAKVQQRYRWDTTAEKHAQIYKNLSNAA